MLSSKFPKNINGELNNAVPKKPIGEGFPFKNSFFFKTI